MRVGTAGLGALALAIALIGICSGCAPAPEDIRSEVGSGDALPAAKVHPDEKITITLWKLHSNEPDQISIEIEPDRRLFVRRYNVRWLDERVDVDTETLDTQHLDKAEFDKLRRRLSVYRPIELHSSGPSILPRTCGFITHGQAIINVSFEDREGRTGSFILQNGCEGSSARRIEKDLKQILIDLPHLDGISGYGWQPS